MTDIELNLWRGNKENLDNVPITDGNLIITKDTGEIFADFDTNRVQVGGTKIQLDDTLTQAGAAADAAAVGERIQKGGTKAFTVLSIDDTNKTITLDSVEGLEVGYLCSAIVTNNYNAFGTITEITNTIVTFDNIPTNYTIDENSYLWAPEHPELGTQEIGSYSAKIGYNNKANALGAFACGQDNIADGKRSFVAGRNNYVGYGGASVGQGNKVYGFFGLTAGDQNTVYSGANNTFVTGYLNQIRGTNAMGNGSYNWATGYNSFVTGQSNTAGADNTFVGGVNSSTYNARCFVFGLRLGTSKEGQVVLGNYNAINATDVLQFGIGDAENSRKNGLALDENGNLSIYNILSNCGNPNKTYWNDSSHSFVSGQSNSLRGINTFATGYGNWVTAKNAMVMGNQSQASGINSFAGGNQSRVYNSNGFVFGDNLNLASNNISGATAFGKYNQDSTSNILEVGIGTSDSNRKNGFVVTTDGRAIVATDPINAMDVATKQYVDSHAGADGYSPTATVTKSGRVSTITITDKNGTTTSKVYDGTNGTNGDDGYSPTATVTRISNGATITITDKDGTTTATVYDGEDSITPAKYITNFTTQTATNLVGDTAGTWKITTWSDGTKEAELIYTINPGNCTAESDGTYKVTLNAQGAAYVNYPTGFSSSDYCEAFILNNQYAIVPRISDSNGMMGTFIGYSFVTVPDHTTKIKYKITKA